MLMISREKKLPVVDNQLFRAGTHSFKFDGSDISGGIYLYKIAFNPSSGNKPSVLTKRMALIK